MALKNYEIPTKTVDLGDGQSFDVRGLTIPHIMYVVSRHRAAIDTLVNDFKDNADKDAAVETIAAKLVTDAPEVLAELVAIATGEAEDRDGNIILTEMEALKRVVKQLPFAVQLDTIVNVGEMTFSASGGVKNLLETVIRVSRSAANLAVDLKTSTLSFLTSGSK